MLAGVKWLKKAQQSGKMQESGEALQAEVITDEDSGDRRSEGR